MSMIFTNVRRMIGVAVEAVTVAYESAVDGAKAQAAQALAALSAALAASGGADLLGWMQAGAGSVSRTVGDKLRRVLDPRDKGAAGGAGGDDTAAIAATVAENRSFTLAEGRYLATPAKSLEAPAISAPGAVVSGPGEWVVKPGAYYGGVPGKEDNYAFFKLTAAAAAARGYRFNGNGQATVGPYSATGPNVQFFPVLAYGDVAGQKVDDIDVVACGGHAVEVFQGRRKIISRITALGHNGVVLNGADASIMADCASQDATDSHYNFGHNRASVAHGLVALGNDRNGGGIDIDGGESIVLSASVFRGGQSFGAWLRESAQQGAAPLKKALISGVLLEDNCNFPRDEQAELMLGNPDDLNAVPGSDWAVIGSMIVPKDTPAAGGYNAGIWLHPKLERAAVVGTVFTGDLPTSGAKAYAIKNMGAKGVVMAGNVSLKPGALVTAPDPARKPDGWAYRNNVGMRLDIDSVHVPSEMESSDGKWDYHIVRKLPKSGMAFFTIDYLGGFCTEVIEVTLLQEGDTGYRKRRFVVRGANGSVPVILDNTTEFFGTAPPEVSIAPDTSSIVIGGFTNASAAAGSYACAIDIKIITPYDGAARFRPSFAY